MGPAGPDRAEQTADLPEPVDLIDGGVRWLIAQSQQARLLERLRLAETKPGRDRAGGRRPLFGAVGSEQHGWSHRRRGAGRCAMRSPAGSPGWSRRPTPAPGFHIPIGFYFAKLWYYERTYPLVFTVQALEKAHALTELDRLWMDDAMMTLQPLTRRSYHVG